MFAGGRLTVGVAYVPRLAAAMLRAMRAGGPLNANWALRGYVRSSRARNQLVERLDAALEGFWLGLLDPEVLGSLDEAFYQQFAEQVGDGRATYGEDEHNLRGLFGWEVAALEAHFPPAGRVIVTGAGGGREVVALRNRGLDAIGYEPNAELVAAGRDLLSREGLPQALHPMGRDAFPADAPSCEAVIVGWASYMHVVGRARRVSFLRAARTRLPGGAPILLSFFLREPDSWRFDAVARVAGAVGRLRGREPVELGDRLEGHYRHHFVEEEVRRELEDGGFRMVEFAPKPYAHAVGLAA